MISATPSSPLLVVMGVSGPGKTTVGAALDGVKPLTEFFVSANIVLRLDGRRN